MRWCRRPAAPSSRPGAVIPVSDCTHPRLSPLAGSGKGRQPPLVEPHLGLMAAPRLLVPDLAWIGGGFQADRAVLLGDDGRIAGVASRPLDEAAGQAASSMDDDGNGGADASVLRLPGRALIPGFVNAHSHAFQRLIRGRTQWGPATGAHTVEDFWSWRRAMYDAALGLDAEEIYHVSRFCFLEMMRSGITTVGEFHYLHHQPDGRPYPDPNEAAKRVIAAAESVGLRIVLLNVCYAAGGIGRPLEERQRRFRAESLAAFVERTSELADSTAGCGLATVGVAPHSVRAVPRDWLSGLRDWAIERDAPVHMHVSERTAEVEECVSAHGARPVELLAAEGLLEPRFTAVHATHLSDREVALLGDSGATVCACPTTERDLGDGFLRGLELLDAGAPICLGTDSHTNLDFLEEMRLIEYHERLNRRQRVVIARELGERREVAPPLLDMATVAGARSLRVDAGRIEPGALADLVAIDLDHPCLAGWSPASLPAMLALSATPDVVRDVWIDGVRRISDRHHLVAAGATDAFRAVASKHAPPDSP